MTFHFSFCQTMRVSFAGVMQRMKSVNGEQGIEARMRRLRVSTALLFVVLCTIHPPLATVCHAQTGLATLNGQITDPKGAVVPNTAVEAVNIDTNVTYPTKTNNVGLYTISALPPGRYRVHVVRDGFKEVNLTGVELHTQDVLQQNFKLEVGSASESITVDANAEHMETTNPAVGLLVNRDFVENMPLNGRSLQDLFALAPGTVSNSDRTGGYYDINGQRNDANYFVVDGVAANTDTQALNGGYSAQGLAGALPAQTALGTTQSLVPVDDLQEFKIQTSGYQAEYGRQPGGQVELTTRSGTNELHGSLFEYFRNDVFDANDYFFKQEEIPRQRERQNDFGGSFGGPVEVPHIYNGKDKTFYFVSYEGLRLGLPAFSGQQVVPTSQFRQLGAPAIQPFLNSIPLPNGPDLGDQCAQSLNPANTFSCSAEFFAAYTNPSSLDSPNIRIDQIIGKKVQAFLRYAHTSSSQDDQNTSFIGEFDTAQSNSGGWTLGVTARLSSSIADELHFNYTASASVGTGAPDTIGGAVPYARNLVIPSQYAPVGSPASGSFSIFLPEGETFFTPAYNGLRGEQRQLNFIDSISWTRGSHLLKFGADYRKLSPLYSQQLYAAGLFAVSLANVEDGVASAIVGTTRAAHPTFNNLSMYVQDHWNLFSRLTVDFGLRWEFNPAPGASDGLYPLALTGSNLATAQLAPPGTPQYRTNYDDFAPRVGFAYRAIDSPIHATTVRGGFGIFFDTGQQLGAAGYSGYPFGADREVLNVQLPGTPSDFAPPSLNFPLVPPYGFLRGISDPSLKLPHTAQWNLSLDESLSPKNTLTASYVGNVSKKLLFSGAYQGGTINPDFGTNGLTYVNNAGWSSYNSMQLQDQGEVASGLQLICSYTWAHARDNSSSTGGSIFGPERGNSDNDVRQVLNLATNYRIPGGGSNRFIRSSTDGWSWDLRFTAQTGMPVNVIAGGFIGPGGIGETVRADLLPEVPIYLHDVPGALGGWRLNPSAFAGLVGDGRTPAGTIPVDANGNPVRQGTLGRNFLHGPNFWNLNTAVQRDLSLGDKLHVAFRVEAFNLFNHANGGNIANLLYASSLFGESTGESTGMGVSNTSPTIGAPNQLYGTGAARSLQLSLRLKL